MMLDSMMMASPFFSSGMPTTAIFRSVSSSSPRTSMMAASSVS